MTPENLVQYSLGGIARGIAVHSLIHPLEVIKIRLQCADAKSTSVRLAQTILQKEGINAFYKGLTPQLLKTCIKQIWCWPMIMGMPSILQKYEIGSVGQQALTGLSIATVDAVVSTPLERTRIVFASSGQGKFNFMKVYKEGWKGFAAHWTKLSVNWAAFLTAQQYFRTQSKNGSKQTLTSIEQVRIGVQVALMISVPSAPFDRANTLRQAKNMSFREVIRTEGVFKLYRGWPLYMLTLSIHNIASVFLIEKLSKQQSQ